MRSFFNVLVIIFSTLAASADTRWQKISSGDVSRADLIRNTDGVFHTNNYYSPDGISWETTTFPPHNHWINASGYGGGTFVLTGATGQIWTSTDFDNWTTRNPGGEDIIDVVFGDGVFVARKYWSSSEVWVSADLGSRWQTANTGSVPDKSGYNFLAYGNGSFIRPASNGVHTSTDGISWSTVYPSNIPADFSFIYRLYYSENTGFFLSNVVGRNGSEVSITTAVSSAGEEWQFYNATISTNISGNFQSTGFVGNLIFLTGYDNSTDQTEVWVSNNLGANWSKIENGPWTSTDNDWATFASNGIIVAVGTGSEIYTTQLSNLLVGVENDSDTDGDGVPNILEITEGTDPNDAGSYNSFSAGLVAYYPFDGNANDECVYSNDGIVYGASLGADRNNIANSSYDFDGSDDYIDLGDPDILDLGVSNYTYSLWFRANPTDTGRYILSKYQTLGANAFGIGTSTWSGNHYIYSFFAGDNHSDAVSLGGTNNINDGAWHHVVMAIDLDNNEYNLYMDGVLEGTKNFPVTSLGIDNEYPLLIGKQVNGQNFDGSIDDVRIYNRVLSGSEVTALYESEIGVPPATVYESYGSVSLLYGDGYGYYIGDESRSLKYDGDQLGNIPGWTYLGVESDGALGYDMIIRNDDTYEYVRWSLDSDGNITGGDYLSVSELRGLETRFGQDLDGDDQIGVPPATVYESYGSVSLLYGDGYGYYIGDESRSLKYEGDQLGNIPGWTYLGVESDGALGYDMIIRNDDTGEYVRWSLDSDGNITGGDYLSVSELRGLETRFGQDLDGDDQIGVPPATVYESYGSVSLLYGDGYGYYIGDESLSLKYEGDQLGNIPGWTYLGVESDGALGYDMIIRNDDTYEYVRWSLDSDGNITGGDYLSVSELRGLETRFGQDLDGDDQIGVPPASIFESYGSVNLLYGDGYGYYIGDESRSLKYEGDQLGNIPGWTYLGVESDGALGYDMIIRNDDTYEYVRWSLDSDGNITGGDYLSVSELRGLETRFGQDLDGDDQIGVPPASIFESYGSVNLLYGDGYGYYIGDESRSLKYEGDQLGNIPGWTYLGVESDGALGYDMIIRNDDTGEYVRWSLDSDGNITGGDYLSVSELRGLETRFGQDLDGDDQIGVPPASIFESYGSVSLLYGDGYGYYIGDESRSLKYEGDQLGNIPGWTYLGVESDGALGYDMIIRNDDTGEYVRWSLDSDGNITGGDYLSVSELRGLETRFGQDLDGDDQIGVPPASIFESYGSVSLLYGDGYGYYIGDESRSLKYEGDQLGNIPGWTYLGVESDGALGYDMIIRNDDTGEYVRWSLDSDGNITGGDYLSVSELRGYEANFDQDFDGDDYKGVNPNEQRPSDPWLTGYQIIGTLPDGAQVKLYFLDGQTLLGIHGSLWLDSYTVSDSVITIGNENPAEVVITLNSEYSATVTLHDDGEWEQFDMPIAIAQFDPSVAWDLLLNRSINEDFSLANVAFGSELNLDTLSSYNFSYDDEYTPTGDIRATIADNELTFRKVTDTDEDDWAASFEALSLSELNRDFQITTLVETEGDSGLYSQAGLVIEPAGLSNFWDCYFLEAMVSSLNNGENYTIRVQQYIDEHHRTEHPHGYFWIDTLTDIPDTGKIRIAIKNDAANQVLRVQYMGADEDPSDGSLWHTAYEYRYKTGDWTVYDYAWGEVRDNQGTKISDDWGNNSTQTFNSLTFQSLIQSNFNLEAIEVELVGWFFNDADPINWINAVTRYSDFTISY